MVGIERAASNLKIYVVDRVEVTGNTKDVFTTQGFEGVFGNTDFYTNFTDTVCVSIFFVLGGEDEGGSEFVVGLWNSDKGVVGVREDESRLTNKGLVSSNRLGV